MNDQKIEKVEAQTFNEDDSLEIPPGDIVAYNELRSCADLYRMYREDVLQIQPEFQRNIVWQNPGRTRFIDSLIKQLPIPSMCFSLDYKTQKWQVIDGLQRISTIIAFLGDENWTLSKLDDIDPQLSGKPVREFRSQTDDLYKFYTRIQNLTLPVTVLRCDLSKKSHSNYLFTIFHRLNTGGMKLNNQEIRNCIYGGSFNVLLRELAKNLQWKSLNRSRGGRQDRMQVEEVTLRIFAFNERYEKYSGRLAQFLNEYMAERKNPSKEKLLDFESIFNRTLTLVLGRVLVNKPSGKIGVSLLESLMVGVARNLDRLECSDTDLSGYFDRLRAHTEFSETALREGLAGTARVKGRLGAAIDLFSRV